MSNKSKILNSEIDFSQGQKVEINTLDENDTHLVQHFLRHYRQQYLNIQNEKGNLQISLENLRNYIKMGDLDQSHIEIQNIEPQIDSNNVLYPEFLLEKARFFLLIKNEFEALKITAEILSKNGVSSLTKMTTCQLRADLYFKIGDLSSAEQNARKAVVESLRFPIASSRFSAIGFLIIILGHQGQLDEASRWLQNLRSLVDGIKQDNVWLDRMLILQRTYFRYYSINGEVHRALGHLSISKELAQWSGEQELVQRCINDGHEQQVLDFAPEIYEKGHLTWIPSISVLLDKANNIFYRLQPESVQVKMLHCILTQVKNSEQMFESIWGLSYDKERHSSLLRTHLYQLRKKIPGLKLVENEK